MLILFQSTLVTVSYVTTDLPDKYIMQMGQLDPSAVTQPAAHGSVPPAPLNYGHVPNASPPMYSPVPTTPPSNYDKVSCALPPNYSPVPSAHPPAYEVIMSSVGLLNQKIYLKTVNTHLNPVNNLNLQLYLLTCCNCCAAQLWYTVFCYCSMKIFRPEDE